MKHKLRPYQSESLDNLRHAIKRGSRSIVLQLSAGGGKTSIAAEIMKGAVEKGNRAWFIVDTVELVDQAYRRFEDEGLSCGVIMGKDERTDYSKPVQVATIQTLRNRWDQVAQALRPTVIIVDECHVHHLAHSTLIDESVPSGCVVIGLSATPWRKGLGKHYDEIVVGATVERLIGEGYLCPVTYYAPGKPDLDGVKTSSNGDWQEDALAEVMGDAELMGDIIQHWQQLAHDRQTIVFACNVGHSRSLCAAFKKIGVKADHIDGYMNDPEERKRIIDGYRSGEVQVLCNVGIATKGFDAPDTGCLVIARPTKSLMLHHQMLGRGIRVGALHEDCIVLDHAGNIRNGLPTDLVPTTLDQGDLGHQMDRKKEEKDEPLAKPCPSCSYVSQLHRCPSCGFQPERRHDVEVKEGKLYPVTEVHAPKWSTEGLRDLYAEMLFFSRSKGFKDGWAYHKCREFAGRAPNNTKQIPPKHPSQRTLGIIEHMRIKNLKQRAKEQAGADK